MLNKSLALIVLVIFAAGCGVESRTYVMTRERVGLERGEGNGGCVVGSCPPAELPQKTTRKVYVWELTKPVPESEVRKIEESAASTVVSSPSTSSEETSYASMAQEEASASNQIIVPAVGDVQGASPSVPSVDNVGAMQAQTYTVQKDDTLQKVSKKMYGTYSKWYKIYQANKDKINNPNVLKPGTVLTIPEIKS
jgi:nucleoid-associated protein YgaU